MQCVFLMLTPDAAVLCVCSKMSRRRQVAAADSRLYRSGRHFRVARETFSRQPLILSEVFFDSCMRELQGGHATTNRIAIGQRASAGTARAKHAGIYTRAGSHRRFSPPASPPQIPEKQLAHFRLLTFATLSRLLPFPSPAVYAGPSRGFHCTRPKARAPCGCFRAAPRASVYDARGGRRFQQAPVSQ